MLKKVSNSHIYSQPQKVSLVFLPLFAIWISFYVFCPELVPWIFENTKDDFSTTHSLFRQRRKQLGTDCLSVQFETVVTPNSVGVRNWRSHLQVTHGLSYSYSSSPLELCLFPLNILYRGFYLALISAKLGMSFVSLGCISPSGVMSRVLQILRFWKHLFR